MKLDEKRQAIEVLLCNAQWVGGCSHATTWWTCAHLGHSLSSSVAHATGACWAVAYRNSGYTAQHSDASLEAAYRLIESSPTLRREWFGAP